MRKLILSLLFGLLFSVSYLGAQESIEVPVSSKDSTEVVQTIKLKFERPKTSVSNVNVRYKNLVESLTEEQINWIISIIEARGNASVEAFLLVGESLMTLNSLLQNENYLQNKVIYQADKHYTLSESEVKRILRSDQTLSMFAYGLIFLFFIVMVRNARKDDIMIAGFIDLDKLISILLIFGAEAFTIWYIVRPLVSLVTNRDFENIKFLLQGI